MELEDLRLTAQRSWRLHLFACVTLLVILTLASMRLYGLFSTNALASQWEVVWSLMLLSIIAYLAEWTRHEWRERNLIKGFESVPTDSELMVAKRKDRVYRLRLNATLVFCVFGLLAWQQLKSGIATFPILLWLMPVAAVGMLVSIWSVTQRS